jgi:hypothetical protein
MLIDRSYLKEKGLCKIISCIMQWYVLIQDWWQIEVSPSLSIPCISLETLMCLRHVF